MVLEGNKMSSSHQDMPLPSTLPYFFGYKTEFFFLNKSKDLDSSYKTDLDLWDCLERVKLVSQLLQQNFIVILWRGKPRLIAE